MTNKEFLYGGKSNPNLKNKANMTWNIICTKSVITMDYGDLRQFQAAKNKANSKPISRVSKRAGGCRGIAIISLNLDCKSV
jgi:hypothetical protein